MPLTNPPTPEIKRANSSRDPPFSIQEFGDLVASALDIQSIPDSTLDFSFVGRAYPMARRPSSYRSKQGSPKKLRKARRIFTDSDMAHSDTANVLAPQLPALNNDIPRLASFSLPVLHNPVSQGEQQYIQSSFSFASFEDIKVVNSQSCPLLSPSEAELSPAADLTPASEDRKSELNFQQIDCSHPTISRLTPRLFFKLKPSAKDKSVKKQLDSGSNPDQKSNSYNNVPSLIYSNDSPITESEGMHSFFDDSGYADIETTSSKMEKKRSLPILRSFFTSKSFSKGTSFIKQDRKKELSTSSIPTLKSKQSASSKPSLHDRTREAGLLYQDDLFYTPNKQLQQCDRENTLTTKDLNKSQASEWTNQPLEKGVVGITTCDSDGLCSNYNLSPEGSLEVPLPSSGSPSDPYGAKDKISSMECRSVDSAEIHSWREPTSDIPESSCSSCSYDPLMRLEAESSSKGDNKKRLGITPNLNLNVPLLSRRERPASRDAPRDKPKRPKRLHGIPRLRLQATSGLLTSNPMLPIVKLASSSLVSLRTISTITGGSKAICDEDQPSPHRSSLELERPFTPEEDPFAATPQTPLTPVDPAFYSKSHSKENLKSFLPLGNEPGISPDRLNTSASFPGWRYPFRPTSSQSSPALTPPQTSTGLLSPSKTANGLLSIPCSKVKSTRRNTLLRTPSTPSIPQRKTLHINTFLANNKSNKAEQKKGHEVSARPDSRPSSPFPMLFRKSRGRKPSSNATRESPVSSNISTPTSDVFNFSPITSTPVCQKQRASPSHWSAPSSLLLSRKLEGLVQESHEVGSQGADALIDPNVIQQGGEHLSTPKRTDPSTWIPEIVLNLGEKQVVEEELSILGFDGDVSGGDEEGLTRYPSFQREVVKCARDVSSEATVPHPSSNIRRHMPACEGDIEVSSRSFNPQTDKIKARTQRKNIRHITSNLETRKMDRLYHKDGRITVGDRMPKLSASLPETRQGASMHNDPNVRGMQRKEYRPHDSPRSYSPGSNSNTSVEVGSYRTTKSVKSDNRSVYYTVRSNESRGTFTTYSSARSFHVGSGSMDSHDGTPAHASETSISSSLHTQDSELDC